MNNEQRVIVDDILYQKIKNLTTPFPFFLIGATRIEKTFTFMLYYTKQVMTLY
jgi:hypothetical protein